MADNRNISSLVNTNTLNILSSVQRPKSFGDQLSNDNEKIVNSSLGKKQELQVELKKLVTEKIEETVKYEKTLNDLFNQFQPPPPTKATLTFEQYELKKKDAETAYTKRTNKIDLQKNEIDKQIKDISNDPYQNIKNSTKRREVKNNKKIQRAKNKENKEKKLLSKKVLQNLSKTIASLVSLQATKLLFSIVFNNKKLQELIDDTNTIIDAATTQEAINNARVIRNSTLAIIINNERKLDSLNKIVDNANRVVTILNISLTAIILLFTIPKPFGLGPTMPTPIANKVKKFQDLVVALNILISIIRGILDSKLNELNDLKSQLNQLNNILDNTLINNLSNEQLQSFINEQRNLQSKFAEYKGFKLEIREEETLGAQQAVVVRNNIKRKYAVALDKDGVPVLKSDFSFTLDPVDLIEQLKLIIDNNNLQA
jgi:hypothetical protein